MTYNKFNITDGTTKARVHYSHGIRVSTGRNMITIYEKGATNNLQKIFKTVENETDIMTDYFDDNKVRFDEGTPEYNTLLAKMKAWDLA